MKTYIIQVCACDGSTPLDQVIEVEVAAQDYRRARALALLAYPDHDVISWGVKQEIEEAAANT